LRSWFKHRRDFYAGGLIILFGLVAAVKGPGYGTGTLMRMGPGYMPTVLGVILVLLGIAIAGTALTQPPSDDEKLLPDHPQWFGWGCILAGPILFIILGNLVGLLPATFACVFVSSLGDRQASLKASLVLAAGVSVFGVFLFSYILQISMPVLTWRGL
jgi:uncharacterized membrane protein YhdT